MKNLLRFCKKFVKIVVLLVLISCLSSRVQTGQLHLFHREAQTFWLLLLSENILLNMQKFLQKNEPLFSAMGTEKNRNGFGWCLEIQLQ